MLGIQWLTRVSMGTLTSLWLSRPTQKLWCTSAYIYMTERVWICLRHSLYWSTQIHGKHTLKWPLLRISPLVNNWSWVQPSVLLWTHFISLIRKLNSSFKQSLLYTCKSFDVVFWYTHIMLKGPKLKNWFPDSPPAPALQFVSTAVLQLLCSFSAITKRMWTPETWPSHHAMM